MKLSGLFTALCVCGLATGSLPVNAANATLCSDSQLMLRLDLNPGYVSCLNPRSGAPFGSGTADLMRLEAAFGMPWQRVGLSTDSGPSLFGPFNADPTGLRSGTLELDMPRADLFVIGLQAIDETAFYRFNYTGLAATRSISFDTLGIDSSLSDPPQLQIAALYLPANVQPPPGPGPLPEPATFVLALTGLGVLAACRRPRGT